MHGLINRAVQRFVTDSYGTECWSRVADLSDAPADGFEAMLEYPDACTDRLVDAAVSVLDKDRADFLEDLGTYLVSHPHLEPLRRLLRFSGDSFLEFVHALDDLPERARLAVPELDFPGLLLRQFSAGEFLLRCDWHNDDAVHVVLGALRAVADDYGALAVLTCEGVSGDRAVRISLLDVRFAEGRRFELAPGPA